MASQQVRQDEGMEADSFSITAREHQSFREGYNAGINHMRTRELHCTDEELLVFMTGYQAFFASQDGPAGTNGMIGALRQGMHTLAEHRNQERWGYRG